MVGAEQTSTSSKTVERLLWFGGLLCLGFCGLTALNATNAEHITERNYPATPNRRTYPRPAQGLDAAHVEGRLEISALHVSVPILSECSDSALRLGSCHVAGTATAGGLGNMGIAGHRDGSFRSVRNIQTGQVIDVFGDDGHFQYVVDTMAVVSADDVSVLSIGTQPELTLITCFPFNYIGAAPKRFIVHAHLLSVQSN